MKKESKIDLKSLKEKELKMISKLKVSGEVDKPVPFTKKHRELVEKIFKKPDLSERLCNQYLGQIEFRFITVRGNEYLISINDDYYFYNKMTGVGIFFGHFSTTWLDSEKKIPWTEKEEEKVEEEEETSTVVRKRRRK